MKKYLFIALAILPLALTSCDKCQVCTKQSSPEIRFCRSDYNSDDDYNNNIEFTEQILNYNCNASL